MLCLFLMQDIFMDFFGNYLPIFWKKNTIIWRQFFLRQIREKFASFLLQIVEDRVIMVTHFSALRLKTYSCKMFLQLLTQKETEHKANLLLILYLFKI